MPNGSNLEPDSLALGQAVKIIYDHRLVRAPNMIEIIEEQIGTRVRQRDNLRKHVLQIEDIMMEKLKLRPATAFLFLARPVLFGCQLGPGLPCVPHTFGTP